MPTEKPHRKYTPRPPTIPKLRHHKASNQGFVVLNDRHIYLGRFDLPATKQRYHAVIAEFLANNRTLTPEPQEITITELCALYWKHSAGYYVDRHGRPTKTLGWVKEVVRTVRRLYGSEAAGDFGPNKLRACCQVWIERGLSRKTCNSYLSQLKQLFKWAASRELISGEVNNALNTVGGLKSGRSGAVETEAVKPVLEGDIEAIKTLVSRQVGSLIDLQLLCAARCGELLGLTPNDIDTTGTIWLGKPSDHKMAYRGAARELYFGPKAQAVLKPYLLRDGDAFLFSPREAEDERHRKADGHRRANQKQAPPKTGRRVGARYTPPSYRRAIERACDVAGIQRWTPHRLRHSAATAIRKEYGLEASQLILGHANANVTQIYAEADRQKAFSIIAEIG